MAAYHWVATSADRTSEGIIADKVDCRVALEQASRIVAAANRTEPKHSNPVTIEVRFDGEPVVSGTFDLDHSFFAEIDYTIGGGYRKAKEHANG